MSGSCHKKYGEIAIVFSILSTAVYQASSCQTRLFYYPPLAHPVPPRTLNILPACEFYSLYLSLQATSVHPLLPPHDCRYLHTSFLLFGKSKSPARNRKFFSAFSRGPLGRAKTFSLPSLLLRLFRDPEIAASTMVDKLCCYGPSISRSSVRAEQYG